MGRGISKESRHFLRQLPKFKTREWTTSAATARLALPLGSRCWLAAGLIWPCRCWRDGAGHAVDGPPPLSHDVLREAHYTKICTCAKLNFQQRCLCKKNLFGPPAGTEQSEPQRSNSVDAAFIMLFMDLEQGTMDSVLARPFFVWCWEQLAGPLH